MFVRSRGAGAGRLFWGLLMLLLLAGCGSAAPNQSTADSTSTPPPLQMQQYENPAAFDLLYPHTWSYLIPNQGLVVFSNEEATNIGEIGHSLTVLRIPLSDVRGDLSEMLQHYLDNGPLASGFSVEVPTLETTLGGRPALETLLTSEAAGDLPAQTAYVAAAETEKGHVYILAGVAPSKDWEAVAEQFVVMVHSVEFNE